MSGQGNADRKRGTRKRGRQRKRGRKREHLTRA